MAVDVLILNTAVTDIRRPDFIFADELVGAGGLAKCHTKDMPDYSQEQLTEWIQGGDATAGGPGNSAPLMARAGLKVAVAVYLGRGQYDGLDAHGRYFHDVMTANNIDMSAALVHPSLATGATFIHSTEGDDRGGIAYFPNANDDFDFEAFKPAVERLQPAIVYYMYSGLSDRGDANGGKDLANFIRFCRDRGAVTIADCHTLTANPQELIESGQAVAEYRLLEPLLPELDLFFTSCDEAKLIINTIGEKRSWSQFSEDHNDAHFLDFVIGRFRTGSGRARLFGVTVANGAFVTHGAPDGGSWGPTKIESRFMAGEIVDLVGAGDSFRAGLLSYLAKNLDAFRAGAMDVVEAVQMGNLFASLFIKAPLGDRYGNIRAFEKLLRIVRADETYTTFETLRKALD